MEDKVTIQNKIKRKKFFASLGIAAAGVAVFNQFPFSLFKNKNEVKTAGKIKVEINPLAVNRKKSAAVKSGDRIGDKNVRS